jgi:hypothetical protein
MPPKMRVAALDLSDLLMVCLTLKDAYVAGAPGACGAGGVDGSCMERRGEGEWKKEARKGGREGRGDLLVVVVFVHTFIFFSSPFKHLRIHPRNIFCSGLSRENTLCDYQPCDIDIW